MRLALAALAAVAFAVPASAATRFRQIAGFPSPGTPATYDKVGILQFGNPKASNVLVLNPGTSSSAAYFAPLARSVVAQAKGWQVWGVERRENLLEDQSVADQAKAGKAGARKLFDYYLGWLEDSSITPHFQMLSESDFGFAKEWGMNTELQDLRRVVLRAKRLGGKVVVGGHSLGGTMTSAYATWDFDGVAGAKGLAGLVFIDGASSTAAATAEEAQKSKDDLAAGSPWLAFGGIPAPFAGLFSEGGGLLVRIAPDVPSVAQNFSALPANLKPPFPVTNAGQYGYALDTETSPPSLAAAQAHLGHIAESGDPRGWVDGGELTPLRRFADAFSGWGIPGHDGVAWYHPQRLTIDSRVVAAGNANPGQEILDVHATHGADLPRSLRILAIGASLGNTRVLDGAQALATQSGIPASRVTLLDRHDTYAHNDPNTATPSRNDFFKALVPFLRRIARG